MVNLFENDAFDFENYDAISPTSSTAFPSSFYIDESLTLTNIPHELYEDIPIIVIQPIIESSEKIISDVDFTFLQLLIGGALLFNGIEMLLPHLDRQSGVVVATIVSSSWALYAMHSLSKFM